MIGGGSIIHVVGVGYLLARLCMVEFLWGLGCLERRRERKSVLYPVWNSPQGITGKDSRW